MAWKKDSHRSIYALKDPRDSAIRYVGVTFYPRRRLKDHCSEALRGDKHTHKCHWIRSLLSAGMEPEVEILDTGSGDFATSEMQWIAKMKSEGHRLTNSTDGGEGFVGHVRTEEQKRKLSESHKGKRLSEEQRRKIGDWSRGRPKNEAQRACLLRGNAAWKGRHHSKETLEKKRSYRASAETKRKMSESHRGKKLSAEHKEKLSIAARQRLQTEDGRAQARAAMQRAIEVSAKMRAGKPVTEETKGKLRIAALARIQTKEGAAQLLRSRLRGTAAWVAKSHNKNAVKS